MQISGRWACRGLPRLRLPRTRREAPPREVWPGGAGVIPRASPGGFRPIAATPRALRCVPAVAARGLPGRGSPADHGPTSRDLGAATWCGSGVFWPGGRPRGPGPARPPGKLAASADPGDDETRVRTRSAGSAGARSAGQTASYKV